MRFLVFLRLMMKVRKEKKKSRLFLEMKRFSNSVECDLHRTFTSSEVIRCRFLRAHSARSVSTPKRIVTTVPRFDPNESIWTGATNCGVWCLVKKPHDERGHCIWNLLHLYCICQDYLPLLSLLFWNNSRHLQSNDNHFKGCYLSSKWKCLFSTTRLVTFLQRNGYWYSVEFIMLTWFRYVLSLQENRNTKTS